MRRSANSKSFKDIFMNKNADKFKTDADLTFEEERLQAEAKSVEFENGRKAQASKFPNASVSTETHPGYMEENTDETKIVEAASRFLKAELGKLVGKGGFNITHEETRVIKCHKDTVDSSKITENAMMAFAVKFELPGLHKSKLAKFAVSFNEGSDERFVLEGKFLDANDKDYPLNSKNLEDFLNTENLEVKTAKSEKPLVWFNYDSDTFESIPTIEGSEKIASRLKTAGYEVDSLFYVDACYGPKEFGRNCYLVKVPMNKEAEFKRFAAMSDDEWINRSIESERVAPYKTPKTEWPDRALEPSGGGKDAFTGYDKKDYNKGDEWINRTEDKGDKGNPYNTAEKMMRDESRKESVKAAIANKPEISSALDKVTKLEKLIG